MKKINTKTIGQLKEKAVVQYLKQKGWTILYQNKKIQGVEIDILAKKQKELILLEVKSIKKESQLENIIKKNQKERLSKAVEILSEKFSENLSCFLATVDSQNKINFFEMTNT